MKHHIHIIITVFLFSFHFFTALAQDCDNCRYISPMFDSVMVETVHFGEGMNIDGDLQQLYADVYQPYGDTVSNRPVVIFAFGGGFVQGSRNDWYVREVCEHFAKAGYVAVANDYRLGIDPLEILFLQHMRIFFRPMQDMRATVQYLKADYSELGNNFRIDTANIFLGGASAGGISALMTEYCDRPEEMAEMGDMGALDDLGGFYATSGFYPQYDWNVAAVVNVAGALVNAAWVEPGDIPIISAHGDQDNIVPYGYGPFGGGALGGFFDLQGSSIVHQEAQAEGVCSYLFTMEGQDHPNEGMGIEYIKSVVHRIGQRAHAVLNDRSFCCELEVDVTPNDTLFTSVLMEAVQLQSVVTNDNGNATLQWCSVPCSVDATGPNLNVLPDTSWKYISLIASEGQCQASDLYILINGQPSSIEEQQEGSGISVHPVPAIDRVNVTFDDPFSTQGSQVDIFSAEGKRVFSAPMERNMWLNVSEWPSGVYFIQATDGRSVIGSRKLVVN
jgi:para-nitrobenzyl esterase